MNRLTRKTQIAFSLAFVLGIAVSGMAEDMGGRYKLSGSPHVFQITHKGNGSVTIAYKKNGITMDGYLKAAAVQHRLLSGLTYTRHEYEGLYATRYADGSLKTGWTHLSRDGEDRLKVLVFTWENDRWKLESEGTLTRIEVPQKRFYSPARPSCIDFGPRSRFPRPAMPAQATQSSHDLDVQLEELSLDIDF